MPFVPFLAISWQQAAGWLTLLDFCLVALTLLSILSTKRKAVPAVAWIVTVVSLPYLGLLFYWLFGYQSVRRPLERKRRHAAAYRQRKKEERVFRPGSEALDPRWRDLSEAAGKRGASALSAGNDVVLYHDGASTFDAMLDAIKNAKRHVHMEFFIFRADNLGKQFLEALAERARAGVEVRLLYDAVGCWGLSRRSLLGLKQAGGEVAPFLSLSLLRRRVQINLRNHRKLLVVDGEVAFTGGFNIGDEYLGLDPFFGRWRDTFLKLRGPAVRSMQRVFIEDWSFASGLELEENDYVVPAHAVGDVVAQIATSGPDQEAKTIREAYFAAIVSAARRVWIATPYFVPDGSLLDALCFAARNGRDIRLVVPFRPDKWLPFLAGRYYWRDVIAAGVKIYQYTGGFLHSKLMIVDDDWASVGSANFDNRSLYLNFEMTCLMISAQKVTELEAAFLRDLEMSIRVTPAEFEERGYVSQLAENACRLLSPVL